MPSTGKGRFKTAISHNRLYGVKCGDTNHPLFQARLKLLHFMVKNDMTSSFRLTSQYFAAADKFKEYALSAYPVERVEAFYFDDVLGRSAGPSKRRVSGDTSVVSTITSSLQQAMQSILDDLCQSVDACSKREADATPNFKELLRIKGVWSSYRVLVEAHWGLHIRLGSLSDQVQAIGPPNLTQATELFEDVFFTTGSDQLSRLVSLQSELSRISVSIFKTHGPQTLNQSELSGISVSRLPSLPGSTSVNTSCSKSNQKYDALTLLPLSPPPRSLSLSLPLSLSLSLASSDGPDANSHDAQRVSFSPQQVLRKRPWEALRDVGDRDQRVEWRRRLCGCSYYTRLPASLASYSCETILSISISFCYSLSPLHPLVPLPFTPPERPKSAPAASKYRQESYTLHPTPCHHLGSLPRLPYTLHPEP